MGSGLQPYALQAATPCAPGCHYVTQVRAVGEAARRDGLRVVTQGGRCAPRAVGRCQPALWSRLQPAASSLQPRAIQPAAPCNPVCSPTAPGLHPRALPAACSVPPPACRPVFIHLCYDIKNGFNRKGQLSMAVWLAQPGWLQVRAPPSVVVRG